jgi:hypothetical protein
VVVARQRCGEEVTELNSPGLSSSRAKAAEPPKSRDLIAR